MARQVCLKWNNQFLMMKEFKNFLLTDSMVDVTLVCDGRSMKAHKLVLSACSSFFKSLFVENPCKHPIVILRDTKYAELKAILDFMYCGEINLPEGQLSALIETAQILRVRGLGEVDSQNNRSDNVTENASDVELFENQSDDGSVSTLDASNFAFSRKQLESDQNSDVDYIPEIKQESESNDMNQNVSNQSSPTVPLQSCNTNPLESQQDQTIGRNFDKNIVPEKILKSSTPNSCKKSKTKDSVPKQSVQSSVQLNLQQCQIRLVPLASTSIHVSSDALVDAPTQSSSGGVKSYRCSICSFKTIYKKNLRRHTTRKHNEPKQFKCNQCPYSTTYKKNLNHHLAGVHRKDILHHCSQCDYKSAEHSKLKRHIENVHEGKKKFQCKDCDFYSSVNSGLKKHRLQIHKR